MVGGELLLPRLPCLLDGQGPHGRHRHPRLDGELAHQLWLVRLLEVAHRSVAPLLCKPLYVLRAQLPGHARLKALQVNCLSLLHGVEVIVNRRLHRFRRLLETLHPVVRTHEALRKRRQILGLPVDARHEDRLTDVLGVVIHHGVGLLVDDGVTAVVQVIPDVFKVVVQHA